MTDRMSVLIWIQTVSHSTQIVFLKDIFEKVIFKKVSRHARIQEFFSGGVCGGGGGGGGGGGSGPTSRKLSGRCFFCFFSP